MMSHDLYGIPSLEIKWKNMDPSTLPSCEFVTCTPFEANTVTPHVRAHCSVPSKQKRRECLGAYPVKDITLALNKVSSVVGKRGGIFFRAWSIIWSQKLSRLSAWDCQQVANGRRRIGVLVNPAVHIAAPKIFVETARSRTLGLRDPNKIHVNKEESWKLLYMTWMTISVILRTVVRGHRESFRRPRRD